MNENYTKLATLATAPNTTPSEMLPHAATPLLTVLASSAPGFYAGINSTPDSPSGMQPTQINSTPDSPSGMQPTQYSSASLPDTADIT